MSENLHYEHQISYFGNEFSQIQEYRLKPWHHTYIERIKNTILGQNENFQSKTLVDIGTGEGYVAVEMAKLGLHVIACDLTSQALENIDRFKKQFNLPNIKLIKCKADEIPIKSNSVDYVVANAILEHLPNEKKTVEKWKRILKPKGKMFITVPLKYRYLLPFLIPVNYIHDKRIGHLRRYDKESLQKLFGLNVLYVFYTGHFLKVLGFLLSSIFGTYFFSRVLESSDKKFQNVWYGGSNIIIIFQK